MMTLSAEAVFKEHDILCQETMQAIGLFRKVLILLAYTVGGSALYGVTMGLNTSLTQAAASAIKVPVLFLLTLAICLPTLHFIGLLFGSTIQLKQSFIVLLAGIALTSILLGAFAPISLLFLASGSGYPFLLLMHVGIFTFCGAAGLYSIHRNFVFIRQQTPNEDAASIADHVLKVWTFLYMFVGAQTAFLLSPFIDRQPHFTLFKLPNGNFYSYVWSIILEAMK
jgi:hypothetical protein